MSSFLNADLGSSDDEGDDDYVPEPPKPSSSAKLPSSAPVATHADYGEAEESRKRKAADLLASMREESHANGSTSHSNRAVDHKDGLIEVKRLRRFAGETVEETILVPRESQEAMPPSRSPPQSQDPASKRTLTEPAEEPNNPSIPIAQADPSPSVTKPGRGPKRKPRQSLEAMSAALSQGKKMTTLEKSQLDWKKHTEQTGDVDELANHRKGGGYIEKQQFLDRVGERRDDLVDKSKRR